MTRRRPTPIRPEDSLCILGMESADSDRAQAEAIQAGHDLTAELLRPKADISARAGLMERNAPLFFGTGDNPTLF
jgi:hypothetical protein